MMCVMAVGDPERKLASYLNYCREVIYPGPASDADEEAMRDHFWKVYEKANEVLPDPTHFSLFLFCVILSPILTCPPSLLDKNRTELILEVLKPLYEDLPALSNNLMFGSGNSKQTAR